MRTILSYMREAIVLLIFITPYFFDGWWKFLLATIGILFISKTYLCGLKAPISHYFITGGLILILFLFCRILIIKNASLVNIEYVTNKYSLIWGVAIFFQVLNEEIILRSTLIHIIAKRVKVKLILILGPALLFTILHFLFYYSHGCALNISAMTFILLFGIICNMLFIKFKHIWFGFALHLSWNLTKFTGYFLMNGVSISECQSFNYIEGNINNLFLLIIIFIVTTIVFNIKFINARSKS